MIRSTVNLWILLCGVGLLCGCNTTQPIKSMRPFWNQERATKAERDDFADEESHRDQQDDGDLFLNDRLNQETDVVRGDMIQSGHSAPSHNESPHSYIEEELQYEPVEQQALLRQQWREMDPTLLKQIFQIRRRYRHQLRIQPGNTQPMPGHSRVQVPGATIIPLGHDQFHQQNTQSPNSTVPSNTPIGTTPWRTDPGNTIQQMGNGQGELQPIPRRNSQRVPAENNLSDPMLYGPGGPSQQPRYSDFQPSAIPPGVGQPPSTVPGSLGNPTVPGGVRPNQQPVTPGGQPIRNATLPKEFPGNPGSQVDPNFPNQQLPLLPNDANPADLRNLGNQPPTPAFDPKWVLELQKVITRAESDLATLEPGTTEAERDRYLEQHVNLRLLYLMAGEGQKALRPIAGVEPEVQEFWQQMFWSMSNYFDVARIPQRADRTTQALAQLRTAVNSLQPKAKLELQNVNFCHKIGSFGNYEKFPSDEFSQGQAVLVYAEVSNFQSEPAPDGQHFKTVLRSRIELYNPGPNGGLVEAFDFPATTDLCRKHRHDYFHSYEFTIPQNLTLGPKVLKLIVEDQLSRKVASYTLNFMVK